MAYPNIDYRVASLDMHWLVLGGSIPHRRLQSIDSVTIVVMVELTTVHVCHIYIVPTICIPQLSNDAAHILLPLTGLHVLIY